MPIDRPTLPNTVAPLDSPSAAGPSTHASPAAELSGSGSLSPSGLLAFLPPPPFQRRGAPGARHPATARLGGNDVLMLPPEQPIARGPRFQRALNRALDEMRLDDSASSSPACSDDEAESDSSDDFLVKAESLLTVAPDYWPGGARRAEQLEALQEWGALSSIPADAHALAAGADQLRMQAQTLDPVPSGRDAEEAYQDLSVHGRLRSTLFECQDAGRAWQSAADQYDAACEVARKVGLPAAEIQRLGDAAAHCHAQTERLAVKALLFTAILEFKRGRHGFQRGDLRILQSVLVPLRAALEHGEAGAHRALPLDSAPIEGFDAGLRDISDGLASLSAADANDIQTAWADHRDTAVSSLGYVLSALAFVLRGKPNVPAMIATLRAAVAAPMERARGLCVAAEARRGDPSPSLDSLTDAFDAWCETASGYDDALRVFDDAMSSWPDAARSAPEANEAHRLREELGVCRDSALHEMRDALIGLFSAMTAMTHEPQAENPAPTDGVGELMAPELLMTADLLSRCQALRGKLQASAILQNAGAFDASRLAQPFDALEQYFEGMLGRGANPLDAANDVRTAASAADTAAPAVGRAWGPALRQFSAKCARQRTRLLNNGFQQAHVDSVNFSVQASAEIAPALKCVYGLRQSLPVAWFDPSPEERAAARESEADEFALIASSREMARHVEAHIARMPLPPADAHANIVENHANLQLNLTAIATAQRTVAELIECCALARRTIHEGPRADCASDLRRLAGDARRAGGQATDMLSLGRNKRLTQGIAGERAQRTLQFVRRLARTAQSIDYTLGVLADIADGYQQAHNLCREPILDPVRFQQAAEKQANVIDSAAKDIEATRKQLIASIGTRHSSEYAATVAAQDIEEIRSFTLGLEWRYVLDFDSAKRQWLRGTVRALAARLEGSSESAPPGAGALLDLIEQHLAAGVKILMSASRVDRNDRMTNAVRDNYEIKREAQACREQLKRLPVRARPSVGAGPSQPVGRKDKSAAGKAKRK